jgi:FAD/FMN-containing dehydrogenase
VTDIENLTLRLGDIPLITNKIAVRAKSRDFFWYSPVLKTKLDHITAEAVVCPRTEAEVVITLAACYDLDIPVTPRGGGTGNYAQSMPLAGGIVLDMTRMTAIHAITDGAIRCEPGALIGDLEAETLKHGQEFRMHPSTRETASIGGFISGGSGGVGSLRWGMLADPGNILSLRIATMEARPRLLDLQGQDIAQVQHAYGVTGVITEVEMPLTPAQNWVELLVSFDSWLDCVAAGWDLANQDGICPKQLAAIEAPAPHRYFLRHRKFLAENDSVLCVLAAPNAVDPLIARIKSAGGRVPYRSDSATAEDRKGLPHLHHLCWNHTTLRALKVDPATTYLQLGTRGDDIVGSARDIAEKFPDEIINHVEFSRSQGQARASFLPMVTFTTKARLDQIVARLDGLGIPNWNPHAYTLEEGNYRNPDPAQIALKRQNDPKGLLNPGKLIGWDQPDYVYDAKGNYRYPHLTVPK